MSGGRQKAESGKVATVAHDGAISYLDVQQRIVSIREQSVIIDADVAALYGVETRRVNEAVRNNPDKFPSDYMFELTTAESRVLRSKISTLERGSKGHYSKFNYKAFTEKGLYMLATILKSKRAVAATFAIIETFAKVRGLKRELVELHKEGDKRKQAARIAGRHLALSTLRGQLSGYAGQNSLNIRSRSSSTTELSPSPTPLCLKAVG